MQVNFFFNSIFFYKNVLIFITKKKNYIYKNAWVGSVFVDVRISTLMAAPVRHR